jgi:hypothetical protein
MNDKFFRFEPQSRGVRGVFNEFLCVLCDSAVKIRQGSNLDYLTKANDDSISIERVQPPLFYNLLMGYFWHTLPLGDGMMANEPSGEIRGAFLRGFESAGKPADMAVFTRLESEGRLHCEVIAYFSPAATELANEFDAEPCQRPSRSGLGLLAGDDACWHILFPESKY